MKVEDHIKVPRFPDRLSLESYDNYFDNYLSEIAMESFPQTRPLWEIHLFNYPTSKASGSVVFKLHHALGDGYSLMGALLSCLKRADDPSAPLAFPSFKKSSQSDNGIKSLMRRLPQALNGLLNTFLDFGLGIMKSTFLADDQSPIRSGEEGVEFLPLDIKNMAFSLEQIKLIKASLNVTINDVVAGAVFLGTRLYMERTKKESGRARSTALVLLNTRDVGGYKSVNEMVRNKRDAQKLWGNQFAFLHVSLPKLHQAADQSLDPLQFVFKAHKIIKRKRNSFAAYLTGKLLESIRKYRGGEAAAKYFHRTLMNPSMLFTNLVGPVNKMTLDNHVVTGVYFMLASSNVPKICGVTVASYVNELRIALGTKRGFIDPLKLMRCIEEAYDMILKATLESK